jgi:hypothetical protein
VTVSFYDQDGNTLFTTEEIAPRKQVAAKA